MEESCEAHSEDNKALPDKSKKRLLKTPSQVAALEKFYNEHKYPTEEMKSQLAESIELTEKQVSGWFCHRRLKDKRLLEASANGRQDRSSGIIQDHGSGLRQDSCGSTKQGDNKHFDHKEVESRSGQDFSAANLTYEHGRDGNDINMEDTSSESSLPLQHMLHSQNERPFDTEISRYLPQEKIEAINSTGIRGSYRPSGYLKVKGQVENAAITSVKRQLGRHYREDGPPLGIDFDPLPPGAFESSIRDLDNEPQYRGDPNLLQSPDIPRNQNQPNSGKRYEVCNSKISLDVPDLEGTSFEVAHVSNRRENYLGHQSKPKPLLSDYGIHFPGRNSSLEMDESSAGVTSFYDGRRLYKTRNKDDVERRRIDLVPSHQLYPYDHKVAGGRTKPLLCNSGTASPVNAHREPFEAKHSNLALQHPEILEMEDIGLSRRMAKSKSYGERTAKDASGISSRVMVHPTNEMRVAKGDQNGYPQQHYARRALAAETSPWTNQMKRSTAEMPSSFSEDETAETSSSLD